jgi:microcystin degradation protein MlrC
MGASVSLRLSSSTQNGIEPANAPAYVQPMEHGAFVATRPRLVKDVASGECMCTNAELLDMAVACMQRLQQRGPARQALPA